MVVLSSYPLLACRGRRNIPCFFCNFDSKVLISGKSKEAAFVIVTQTTAKFDFSICLISYFFFLLYFIFSSFSFILFCMVLFSTPSTLIHVHWNKSPSSPIFYVLLCSEWTVFILSLSIFYFRDSDALSSSCILCRMDCRQKCDELKRTESFTIEVRRRLRFSQSVGITACHYCKVNMQRGVLGAHVL